MAQLVNTGTAADLVFTLPAAASAAIFEDDSIAGNGISQLRSTNGTFDTTTFTNPTASLTINRGNIADTLTINSVPDFTAGLTAGSAAAPFGSIAFAGTLALGTNKSLSANAAGTISLPNATSEIGTSGSGAISLTSQRDIRLLTGSSISTVNGDLVLSANQQVSPTSGNFEGILIREATLSTGGTGNIRVIGKGGNDATAPFQHGVRLANGLVQSTSQGIGAGTISLNGTGVAGTTDADGVLIQHQNNLPSSIISHSGDIQITGTGGDGSEMFNRGVAILMGTQIKSLGAGPIAAKITITGIGGTGTDFNEGVDIGGPDTSVTAVDGLIDITGQASTLTTGQFNLGVRVRSGAQITSTGVSGAAGGITISGTGGGGAITNQGIRLEDADTDVSSVGGGVRLTGTATGTSGSFQDGIRFVDGVGIQILGVGSLTVEGIAASDNAAVGVALRLGANSLSTLALAGSLNTFIGDRIILDPNSVVTAGTNTVRLLPKTIGRAIRLGSAVETSANNLELSDAELDRISAGALQIGDAASGPITISGNISRPSPTVVNLTSGGSISFTTGSLNTAGGNLTLTPGSAASVGFATTGNDVATGTASTLDFADDIDLAISINGANVDTQYHQLNVAGKVDLTGVDLVISGTYTPAIGDKFVLVNNDDTDAVVGEFNNLPEGTAFKPAGGALNIDFQITYHGGDGNDVVLTAFKAHVWHNDANRFDVTGPDDEPDGAIVAADALAIINYINGFGSGSIPANAQIGSPYGFLDTSGGIGDVGDDFIAPADALAVINEINGSGEGEPINSFKVTSIPVIESQTLGQFALNEVLDLLAMDIASQPKRRL